MSILNGRFGKAENAQKKVGEGLSNLAFVLLSEARLPSAEVIVQAFRDFAPSPEEIQMDEDDSGDGLLDRIVLLRFNTGEKSFVALMPATIPNGEADAGVQFSISSIIGSWDLPPHCAHLVVTFQSANVFPPIVQLSRFTSLLAAVTKASPAVGVYWGGAGATHDSEFFMSVASQQDVVQGMMLWSGVSIAREKDGRLSLLSLGMSQLNLPDMLIVAGKSSEEAALETLFDFLAYVADRGEKLSERDTVGRTADERLPISYVLSPIDSSSKVLRIELP